MTHEDLLEIGFKLYGETENDPYYKLIYRPPFNFGITSLSGVFLGLNNTEFYLYNNNTRYTDKKELKTLVNILGNEIYGID